MAVVGRDLRPEEAQGRSRRSKVDLSGLVLGGMGSLFSFALWLIGARYTIDGVLSLVNLLLAFLTVPAQLPIPPGWITYACLAPLPIAYSIIEWRKVPFALTDDGWWLAAPGQWIVWLAVYALDALTTWNGMGVIDPAGSVLVRQIAVTDWAKALLTAILTIGPEALLRSMVSIFRHALGKR